MRDDEIADELMTLLVAGHETTASQLAWTFERLTRTPAALAAAEEVERPPWPSGACPSGIQARGRSSG